MKLKFNGFDITHIYDVQLLRKKEDRVFHTLDLFGYVKEKWNDKKNWIPQEILNNYESVSATLPDNLKIGLIAVIDGHSSKFIPDFLSEVLPFAFAYLLAPKITDGIIHESTLLQDIGTVLPQWLHNKLKYEYAPYLKHEMNTKIVPFVGGACLSFAVITENYVCTSTIGDCRICISVNGIPKDLPVQNMDNLNFEELKEMYENNTIFNSCGELGYEQLHKLGPKNRIGASGLRPYGSIGDFIDDKDVFEATIAVHYGIATNEQQELAFNHVSFDQDGKVKQKCLKRFLENNEIRQLKRDIIRRVPFVTVEPISDVEYVALWSDGGVFLTNEVEPANLYNAFERDELEDDDFSYEMVYFQKA